MKNIYEILEFNKILDSLSQYAISDETKDLCLNLKKIDSDKDLYQAISETDSAMSYIRNGFVPNFDAISDISNSMVRLSKNASLNLSELVNISHCLDLSKSLVDFFNEKKLETNLDIYVHSLDPILNLNKEIKKIVVSDTEVSDDASTNLHTIRQKKSLLKEKIHITTNRLLNTYAKYLQDPVVANKDGAICLPVKSEYKNKVDGAIHSISGSQFTIFIEPKEIINLNNEVTETEHLEQLEINKILFELSTKITPYIDIIKSNYTNIIKLDFIFAKAKYAYNTNSTKPILNKDGKINLINARHPLIKENVIVPININLGIDFNSLIITGPNTGGKTVSLKTVGIIELMALSGLFIPASENSLVAIFDNIFADIGDEQNIEQNLSTFSSHMTNIVYILNKGLSSNSLVLLDEICTGTDPVEGANLAISILDALYEKNVKVIATTHYPELKKYALTKEGVKNGAFEFNIDTLKPTYKLLIGIPGKSNAFAISEKLGLDKKIIDKARNLIDTNDIRFEDVISNLEESKLTIEKERVEIENYKQEIENLKNKVKRQEKGLNDRADSIIRQAKEKAHNILYDAKNLADETIKNIKKNGDNLSVSIKERTKLNKGLNDSAISLFEKVKGPSQPLSAKKIKIGATVKILSLNANGIVETLPDKDYNLFVRIGIMRTQVNLRDLELLINDNITIDGTKIKKITNKDGSSKIKLEKSYDVKSEINLIGKNTDEAIFELDKYIDDAYIAHLPTIRIIHGRGTGTLKKAVHDYCRKSSVIKSYRLGDFDEGGDGVTVATFN